MVRVFKTKAKPMTNFSDQFYSPGYTTTVLTSLFKVGRTAELRTCTKTVHSSHLATTLVVISTLLEMTEIIQTPFSTAQT